MRVGSSGLYRLLARVCLMILSVALVLQILVGGKVPGAQHRGSSEEFAFTIITIDSGNVKTLSRSAHSHIRDSSGPELWDEEAGPRGISSLHGYEDENELTTGQVGVRRKVELWPWAARRPSFMAEVERFITYITTPQVQCSQLLLPSEFQDVEPSASPWALCVDGWKLPASQIQPCVSYSFSMDEKDEAFVKRMLWAGCEVHQFDPSRRRESTLDSVQQHRTWIDWRRPRGGAQGRLEDGTPSRLSTIMDALGHREVHFLNMDLESAEWRVLESCLSDGALDRIQQLVLTVHLQWAGFEVGGNDAEVVRFWYSSVRSLHAAGFGLLHSAAEAGHTILRHELPNAHSTYILTWVRTGGHS